MPGPNDLRRLLEERKVLAAGQKSRRFLPNKSLEQILNRDAVRAALSDPSFGIPSHKWENTTQIVIAEARIVFAILLELRLEGNFHQFIENEILDRQLPVDEKNLGDVLSFEGAREFTRRQWEYLAYNFRKGLYRRKIRSEIILPYIEEKVIGGGSYSTVYEVLVHSAHQGFGRNTSANVRNKFYHTSR